MIQLLLPELLEDLPTQSAPSAAASAAQSEEVSKEKAVNVDLINVDLTDLFDFDARDQPKPEEVFVASAQRFPATMSDEEIRQLRIAVLEQTLLTLAHHNTGRVLFQSEVAWVQEDRLDAFSFTVCCKAARLEPDAVRDETLFACKKIAAERGWNI